MIEIDHATLLLVSGGIVRARTRPTDPTTKKALEAVTSSIKDLGDIASQKPDMTQMMMMMMMMRRG
jgi:hypothetical protein